MRKFHNKVQWIKLKEKVRVFTRLCLSIIWAKIIKEKAYIFKCLGVFLICLIALQTSRAIDAYSLYERSKKTKDEMELKLFECENDNIKYKSTVETLGRRLKFELKIDLDDMFQQELKEKSKWK